VYVFFSLLKNIVYKYKMSSSAWANFSNQSAALKGSLQAGPGSSEGAEKEDDKKAFIAEMLQQSSQFSKENVLSKLTDKGERAALGRSALNLIRGEGADPLRQAANAAKAAQAKVESGADTEGIAEGIAKQEASDATNVAIDAVETTGFKAQAAQTALTDGEGRLGEASAQVAEQQTSLAAERTAAIGAADTGAADSAIDAGVARVAVAQGAETAATTERTALAQTFAAQSTAASDAETALGAARDTEAGVSDAAAAAKAIRVAKAVKDTEEAGKIAGEASEADPVALVISGIAAVVSGILGSRVKVHSIVAPPTLNTSDRPSYGDVAGA